MSNSRLIFTFSISYTFTKAIRTPKLVALSVTSQELRRGGGGAFFTKDTLSSPDLESNSFWFEGIPYPVCLSEETKRNEEE